MTSDVYKLDRRGFVSSPESAKKRGFVSDMEEFQYQKEMTIRL